ncbi:MAG: hypothetical protein AAF484_08200 [Pseudomonadota bacterium]
MRQSRTRRAVLTLAAGGLVAGAGFGMTAARLGQDARRMPDLTDAHLRALSRLPPSQTRVLIIGNSATIGAGFLDHLKQKFRGTETDCVRASAHGARLVQSWRIAALRRLVRSVAWRAVVLQDFSSTPLRSADRVGSLAAIAGFARLASPAPVVLFPHWPSGYGHPVYQGGLGAGYAVPDDPEDYASRAETHYSVAARITGARLAPVLSDWIAALKQGGALYARDHHHANEAGAALAASSLFETLNSAPAHHRV